MTITMMVRMAIMPKRVLPRQFPPNPLVPKGLAKPLPKVVGLVLGKTKPLVVIPVGKQAVPVPASQKDLPKPKAQLMKIFHHPNLNLYN